jgi:hypothetical protein
MSAIVSPRAESWNYGGVMQRMKYLLLAMLAVMLVPVAGFGQTRTTGQIVGTVRDATGAVIPNAEIVLIDAGTGNTAESKSGPDGGFVFPNLQPGTYTITATAQGFQPVTLQKVEVLTSRSTDVTVQFQVAGVTEQIQVEGRAAVVETTSTTIANTVRNEEIAKLPMSGRNILDSRCSCRARRGAPAPVTAITTVSPAARSTSRWTASTTIRRASAAAARVSSPSRPSGLAPSRR